MSYSPNGRKPSSEDGNVLERYVQSQVEADHTANGWMISQNDAKIATFRHASMQPKFARSVTFNNNKNKLYAGGRHDMPPLKPATEARSGSLEPDQPSRARSANTRHPAGRPHTPPVDRMSGTDVRQTSDSIIASVGA